MTTTAVTTRPAILRERDLPVPLGDGAVLRADVYRDPAAGPRPTLLQLTAYDKSNWASVNGVLNTVKCRPPANRTPLPQEADGERSAYHAISLTPVSPVPNWVLSSAAHSVLR